MGACPTDISVSGALDLILAAAQPLPTQRLELAEAVGHVLAEDILADSDYPPFDRARMDGFAVRTQDVPHAPAELVIVEEILAGRMPQHALDAGQASRTNTGAPMPAGADAVVPIEQTIVSEDSRRVTILEAPRVNQHTEKRGSIQSEGRRVMRARTCVGAAQVAVVATAGATTVEVFRRPTVSVLVTGSELIAPHHRPAGPQIRDTNGISLQALCEAAGCTVQCREHVIDEPQPLLEAIRRGLSGDLLILSGGVSAGQMDLVPGLLAEAGVKPVFQKVRVRPGRPVQYGRAENGAHVFALPGNPVSCLVCFWLFVRPLIQRLSGFEHCLPSTLTARSTGFMPAAGDRESYWPARARSRVGGSVWADPLPWRGSGDPFPFGEANALIRQEPHGRDVRRGETITILPLELLLSSPHAGDSGP